MEKKEPRGPRSRKRSTPDRAAGTPAEVQAGKGATARPTSPPPAMPADDGAGKAGALAALGNGEGLAGAEPVVIAERVTIVSEMPLDEAGAPIAAEQRYLMIRERAYVFAAERAFEPGGEFGDWLRAEREIDAQLARGGSSGDDATPEM